MSPIKPANSLVSLHKDPIVGIIDLSRVSLESKCSTENLVVWPECSRMGNGVSFFGRKRRQIFKEYFKNYLKNAWEGKNKKKPQKCPGNVKNPWKCPEMLKSPGNAMEMPKPLEMP